MSKFLGPIHFWLYGKIGHQEDLTARLAEDAQARGWIADAAAYKTELLPLEQVIDEGNIHGWLQARISDAEDRYASLVSFLLKADPGRLASLAETAYAFGKSQALPAGTSLEDAYKRFENFFVNGMPCDRVNAVTERNEQELSWEQTSELHAEHWLIHGGDVEAYYLLRKAVMDGMLDGTGLTLEMADKDHYTLKKA